MAKGNIEKRVGRTGTSYRVTLDVGPVEGGRRKRHRETVQGTRRAAERRLRELLTSVEGGTYTEPSTLTVGSYLTGTWLPGIRGTIRETTYQGYVYYVNRVIVRHLGHIRLQRLTPANIQAFYGLLSKEGGMGGRPLAPRTCLHAARVLNTALGHAVKNQLLTRNPASLASAPRPPRHEIVVPAAKDLERVLGELHRRESWAYPVCLLALHLGLRRSELVGLRWRDIDFDARAVRIKRGYHVLVGGKEVVREPKSATSIRSVQLTPAALSCLCNLRQEAQGRALLLGQPLSGDAWLFASPEGRPFRPNSLTNAWRRACKCVGLRISFHTLRHAHATYMLLAGAHPRVVQQRLGHSTVALTLDTYSAVLPGLDRRAAESFEAALNGSAQPTLTSAAAG